MSLLYDVVWYKPGVCAEFIHAAIQLYKPLCATPKQVVRVRCVLQGTLIAACEVGNIGAVRVLFEL